MPNVWDLANLEPNLTTVGSLPGTTRADVQRQRGPLHEAVYIDPHTLHFMEPNIGEYRFRRPTDDAAFVGFGKAYWRECAFRWNNVFSEYQLILLTSRG